MNKAIFIILAFATSLASAVEVEPYPKANINPEQWDQYHSIISTELVTSRRAYDSHKLEVYSDDKTRASIAFTMPGHNAHPAWVTRHVAFKDDKLNVNVIGYFAGNEDAFKILFNQYQQMAKQTQMQFKK